MLALYALLSEHAALSMCQQYWHPVCACRPYAEKYAESQDAFFEDYAKAHLKLSELGVQWDPEPIHLDE